MARTNRTTNRGNQKKEVSRPKEWSNISGHMKLYSNVFKGKNGEYLSYSTSIGRKKQDGSYDNAYMKVFFPKNDDPGIEGLFEIEVKKGFMTLNTYDRGKGKNAEHVVELAIMVQEYDIRDEDFTEEASEEDAPF